MFLDLDAAGAARVAELGAAFLVVAGFFQIFDGAQSVALGALRGLKDTRVPMIIAGFGYWAVAFPVTLICALPARAGRASACGTAWRWGCSWWPSSRPGALPRGRVGLCAGAGLDCRDG